MATHTDESHRLQVIVVEVDAARRLAETEPEWYRWTARLGAEHIVSRISVVEGVAQIVDRLRQLVDQGFDAEVVVGSADSEVVNALQDPGMPNVGIRVIDDEGAAVADTLRTPDPEVVAGWERVCDEQRTPDLNVEPAELALYEIYAESFVAWVRALPEPERTLLTPNQAYLQSVKITEVPAFWAALVECYLRKGYAGRAAEYVKWLSDSESWFRAAAADGIAAIGSSIAQPEVMQALVDRLLDEDGDVRGRAANALGSMGSVAATPEVIQALLERLRDKDGDVRERAANALGNIGSVAATSEVIQALVERLKNDEIDMGSAAATALRAFAAEPQVGDAGLHVPVELAAQSGETLPQPPETKLVKFVSGDGRLGGRVTLEGSVIRAVKVYSDDLELVDVTVTFLVVQPDETVLVRHEETLSESGIGAEGEWRPDLLVQSGFEIGVKEVADGYEVLIVLQAEAEAEPRG